MNDKHGWNDWNQYLSIHQSCIESYQSHFIRLKSIRIATSFGATAVCSQLLSRFFADAPVANSELRRSGRQVQLEVRNPLEMVDVLRHKDATVLKSGGCDEDIGIAYNLPDRPKLTANTGKPLHDLPI
jgi:hypothetical protein